ncbi:MAG: alkene reductase, partial [Gammaproteobacteria bacterium]|nr:alkene reductase [Gammaproteobacteria bacterium]
MKNLFDPLNLGSQTLDNRIVMAPLTRARAEDNHVPGRLMAEHYAQRASAGLIITEATMIMEGNSAFISEPGIYSEEQIKGWQQVTDAVHAKNGKIFLQIWHAGRAAHPTLNNGSQPVAPSAIAIDGEIHTPEGKQNYVVPHELTDDEIPSIINGFKIATENAMLAGFDGVEVHAANGYILDQFLRDGSNK